MPIFHPLRHGGCLLLAMTLLSGGPAFGTTRLLFIGNSYTSVNNLPAVFADLSRAGRHPVFVEMLANGGWTLAQHLAAPSTAKKIESRPWDYVVLQEQSLLPSFSEFRPQRMYPAVRGLVQMIRKHGAQPVLYLTWGRREGFEEVGFSTCSAMQTELNRGYLTIARELNALVAPVGPAWLTGSSRDSGLELWQKDASHPTPAGTYLAACVFYATLFRQSPLGLPASEGVSPELARSLQALALECVLTNPSSWQNL